MKTTKDDFVAQLANEHCQGAFYSPAAGEWMTCGRCPSCRARKLTGTPAEADLLSNVKHVIVCKACGLTAAKEGVADGRQSDD